VYNFLQGSVPTRLPYTLQVVAMVMASDMGADLTDINISSA
jgi:hypothetical protein